MDANLAVSQASRTDEHTGQSPAAVPYDPAASRRQLRALRVVRAKDAGGSAKRARILARERAGRPRSAPHGVRTPARAVLCVAVTFGLLTLLAPSVAFGSFTRPFLRSITRAENVAGALNTKPCSEAERALPGTPCLLPDGIAVDGKDGLWVANDNFHTAESGLAGFAPAYALSEGAFLPPLLSVKGLDVPERVAVEFLSEDFYVTGRTRSNGEAGSVEVYDREGTKLHEWGKFQAAAVAVDNSPTAKAIEDPSSCGTGPLLSSSECFVYVTETGENGGIRKFDPEGKAEPFTTPNTNGEPVQTVEPYIEANKITGIPAQPKGVFQQEGLNAVAVDSRGDIYADNNTLNAVYEYAPSGEFIHSFDLASEEVPRLPGGHVGSAAGLAVDPVSGHLLVSLTGVDGPESVGAVDGFDIEGAEAGKFVTEITETSEGTQLQDPRGLSVDSLGDLYVLDAGRDAVESYEHGAYYPTVTLGAATQRSPSGAVLNAVVNPLAVSNPEHAPLTECYFQFVSEAAYDESEAQKEGGFSDLASGGSRECTPKAGEIAADEKDHEVQARIEGLKGGVTYRYRLVATTDPARKGGMTETAALAFTAPAPPVVLSSSAANVSSTFADLHAQIKPNGVQTSYYFEYGTTTAYGHDAPLLSEAAPRGAEIGSGGPTGGAAEGVLQHLGALTPGTTYYFRVVAVNAFSAPEEPEQGTGTFTTLPQAAPGLPDGRSYELVTPATKEGGSDMFAEKENNGEYFNTGSVGTPSRAGDGFLLGTKSAFGAFPSAFFSEYAFHRDPAAGEWKYTSLASPSLGVQSISESSPFNGGAGLVFDPADLSRVAFTDGVGAEDGEEGARPTDLLGAPGGPYTTLHTDPAFHESERLGHIETQVVGASRDLSHVVLDSNSNTACGAGEAAEKVTSGDVLCEWAAGELRLVNLAPGSESKPASTCGATLGASAVGEGQFGSAHNAVSADGSSVLFTAPQRYTRAEALPSGPGCWNEKQEEETGKPVNPPQLYARVDGQTLTLSAPEKGVKEGTGAPREYPAGYVGASEDGRKVFFVSEAWLTADHPETHDLELYECEITVEEETPACRLTRISSGVPGTPAGKTGANVDWVPAVTADGSTVYFTAFGVLAEGATAQTPAGNGDDGEVNVYRYDTASTTTSYVATVNTEDYTNQPRCIRVLGAIGPCSQVDWYTTANGRYLLFGASLEIAGYNTAVAGCHGEVLFEQNGLDGRCSELYRYDAGASEHGEQPLVCVSCGPAGADSAGNAEFARSATRAAAAEPPAGISENGQYVFFDSPAKLVPQAENHTLDVYEWHEDPLSHARTVALLSSPNDPFPSYFLGSSPYEYRNAAGETKVVEGGNVFFGTHASLVPQDTNTVGNIYDARICVPESPCIKPPTGETAQCSGGNCQTPPPPPVDQTPASQTFSGAGNLTPAPPAPPKPPTAAEVRAKKLAVALKLCRKKRNRHNRATCERAAHKKYATKASKTSKRKG